jgi:hypothetical protein
VSRIQITRMRVPRVQEIRMAETVAHDTPDSPDMTAPWAWVMGAVWLLPGGCQIIVPSFHDEWIRQHQELVPGCANVCDVVLSKGWLSVVSYSQGYVEIMIDSRANAGSVGLCVEHLRRNLDAWRDALVMTMDAEGYIKLVPEDFADPGIPASRIRGSLTEGTASS